MMLGRGSGGSDGWGLDSTPSFRGPRCCNPGAVIETICQSSGAACLTNQCLSPSSSRLSSSQRAVASSCVIDQSLRSRSLSIRALADRGGRRKQPRKASVRAAGLHGQSGVACSDRDYLRRVQYGGGPSLLMASTKVLVFGDRLVVDMRPVNLPG